ncbi:hypothetical protein [Nocardia sp. NPDC005978]|uniref:hypothetical protein n=1 Tax=unclassified Nocardia TaxID=2637762 RepID=UPI0033BA72DC
MSGELAVELRRLEQQGSTGVLRTGDGAFHLTDGAITRADCRRTTGLDRLVIEAGVATAEDWRAAEGGNGGSLLRTPQLETLAVLSVFDAAYFLLANASAPEFKPAPAHWLAPVCHLTPRAIVDECARRGDPEAGLWPATMVDRVPVVPVRRVRTQRVVLTGGQAEVLAAADSRRSITGIAHELGRTTFGCLQAVRDLTAVGLIVEPARAGSTPAPLVMTDSVVVTPAAAAPAGLPRRRARQSAAVTAAERWQPVDRDVLVRVRAALEELA